MGAIDGHKHDHKDHSHSDDDDDHQEDFFSNTSDLKRKFTVQSGDGGTTELLMIDTDDLYQMKT